MAYLEAWLHLLERSPEANTITIFDHGPIYRLTLLREFGPEIVHSQPYARWWARLLRRWTEALDMAIWLDAPNRALLDRIRARERWHSVKDADDREADEFLSRHRTVLEEAIATVGRDGQVTLLRFDSSEEPLEDIVDTVLAAFDSARAARQMRASILEARQMRASILDLQ
jgi:hypothetical protein